MDSESNFIEVLGEASFIETPDLYSVKMEINLTAPQEEKNQLSERFSNIEQPALSLLEKHRNDLTKLEDGGRRLRFNEKRGGIETVISRSFILHFRKMKVLNEFWGEVLAFNSDENQYITFEPSSPVFRADKDHEQKAHEKALIAARDRAESLAMASSLRLGDLVSAKQLALKRGESGAYSDEDWWGEGERFRDFYFIGSSGFVEVDEPERTVYVRYLVRFEIKPD